MFCKDFGSKAAGAMTNSEQFSTRTDAILEVMQGGLIMDLRTAMIHYPSLFEELVQGATEKKEAA
jgi:hypothetical protein